MFYGKKRRLVFKAIKIISFKNIVDFHLFLFKEQFEVSFPLIKQNILSLSQRAFNVDALTVIICDSRFGSVILLFYFFFRNICIVLAVCFISSDILTI